MQAYYWAEKRINKTIKRYKFIIYTYIWSVNFHWIFTYDHLSQNTVSQRPYKTILGH